MNHYDNSRKKNSERVFFRFRNRLAATNECSHKEFKLIQRSSRLYLMLLHFQFGNSYVNNCYLTKCEVGKYQATRLVVITEKNIFVSQRSVMVFISKYPVKN